MLNAKFTHKIYKFKYKKIISKICLKHIFLTFCLFILLLIFLNMTIKLNKIYINKPTHLIEKTNASSRYYEYQLDSLVDKKFSEMTFNEKIGQLFMLSVDQNFNENTNSLIRDYHIGGVILLGYNITSKTNVKQFITKINSISNTPLLIATDQEGGMVARVPWDQAWKISQPHIGNVNREDFAYEVGEEHSKALKNLNINMNLAPVLDIAFTNKSVMANRSLGANPEKVSLLGTSIIKAHQDNGIIPTAKHFPGIGRTEDDSHIKLPIIDISKTTLIKQEIQPFSYAIKNNIDVIMSGHVLYPQIDPKYPASLSKTIITNILREELKYKGIVITDDIHMKSLNNYNEKSIKAFEAGNDIILIVDNYQSKVNEIYEFKEAVKNNRISQERIDESVKRILKLKYKWNIIK